MIRLPSWLSQGPFGALLLTSCLGSNATPPPADCSAGAANVNFFISSGWCLPTWAQARDQLCAQSCTDEGPTSCESSRVVKGPRRNGRLPAHCFYGDDGTLVGASLPTGAAPCVAGVGPARCPAPRFPAFDPQASCPQARCRDERATPRTCVDFEPAPCAATWTAQSGAPAFQCPWSAYGTFAGTCGTVSFTRQLENIGPGTACFYVDGGLSGWSYQSDTMGCPDVGGVIPASCTASALCDAG